MSETWEEKLVKTERVHHDRQQSLEKMGISVQASGIQVEKNKFYLVNLNADPSLNELLVYYLKVNVHQHPIGRLYIYLLFYFRNVLLWAGKMLIFSRTSSCQDWASKLSTVNCLLRMGNCLWNH